jgi:hypothetical protein
MGTLTFDRLKYMEVLKASGVPEPKLARTRMR